MTKDQATYETQLLPMQFIRTNFGSNRKLLWVYAILRKNGISNGGWTAEAEALLVNDYGVATSTANRYIIKLAKLGWITRKGRNVKLTSVHKLTDTRNRYCMTIHDVWLKDYKRFQLFIFSTLLLNKIQADFKVQNRSKAVALDKVSDKLYKSYDQWSATITEKIAGEYMGVSQKTFNRLKKSAAKAGMLRCKFAVSKKIKFNSESDVLNYLGLNSTTGRFLKVEGFYYMVIGSTININSLLRINKYSQVR
jgi:hypothetical protein